MVHACGCVGLAIALIDLATWGTLMVLAEPMRIPRDALMVSLWQARWHLVATFLVAHPVWSLTEWVLRRLRIDPGTTRAVEEAPP